VNICDKGYFALKGENYEVETFHGNWFIDSNGQAVVTLNGDSQFNQRVSVDKTNLSVHDGSLRGPLVCWLLREKRFYLVWTTVSDWSWMWDDLMEISQSNCTKLTGDIKELQQKFSDNQSGFWQALGDFLF
jgi:hypothetical protein